ncbi:penicillin-binding protein 1C [Sinomicrobium weinanense]|uniref:peptidoglycan glycosyltransferase n=1 Tax=Sinomicrobium weinanense TaxID=2842200 RepID=A0A926JNJ6_9FLAO|nr:penicillin-binding protein 1C [Sinomicrobium weinanense]MBC9794491.1 penicillin-binding protein 1C [Sinomicrobium weinanense]MBU3124398.1 penicillin-binding protein 1C [Sinomicrobium weinanense]
MSSYYFSASPEKRIISSGKQFLLNQVLCFIKKHRIKATILAILLIAYYFCLPDPLFRTPTSTVIESRNGALLGARIAEDGQWRFPETDSVPKKFEQCILHFEDAYFYTHPGFNPISIGKALVRNIRAGNVVRGGSTLTQQVIRLSRKGKKRTYFEKVLEIILATRLELRHSKKDILRLYASQAPFGSNVVGLDVAAWRYFGVQPHQLSWAESATLAVLPNAPSLVYPGKNQEKLRIKRNRLLHKLREAKLIDSTTYQLSIAEPLPQKPFPLPRTAPHLLQRMAREHPGQKVRTSIDPALQDRVNTIVKQHHEILKQNEVYNAAVLVMDVHTRQVLAYTGNTPTDKKHQKDVDIINAPRSTGSIMKPFLYAAMLDAGELLPNTLVPDIPTRISSYTPENFNPEYDGAVPAGSALTRSLNIPFVRMLQDYGLERFRDKLQAFRLRDIDRPADYYGLTLILGGAESNLWDLCKTYASLASTVNHFHETSSEYYTGEFAEPVLKANEKAGFGTVSRQKTVFDAGSIFLTFQAMRELNRPEGNEAWQYFDSTKKIAWKTGTSFGNRDAWAIGATKDYVIGVWAGNADGEGRPGLTGVTAAAPILFDVFDALPSSSWFDMPYDELVEAEVCRNSGYLASPLCPKTTAWIPHSGQRTGPCPYHHLVHLDSKRQYRVNTSCTPVTDIIAEPWFTLPPLMEHYYKNNHANYKSLPPFRADCFTDGPVAMDFIYPREDQDVILPKNFEGTTNELVVKVAHSKPGTTVFWYVDDRFLGQTRTFHEMAIIPREGKHLITVIDEFGNEIKRTVRVKK